MISVYKFLIKGHFQATHLITLMQCVITRGPPLEYWGAWIFLEINTFVWKMGEIHK